MAACTTMAAHGRDHQHAISVQRCHPHPAEVIFLGHPGADRLPRLAGGLGSSSRTGRESASPKGTGSRLARPASRRRWLRQAERSLQSRRRGVPSPALFSCQCGCASTVLIGAAHRQTAPARSVELNLLELSQQCGSVGALAHECADRPAQVRIQGLHQCEGRPAQVRSISESFDRAKESFGPSPLSAANGPRRSPKGVLRAGPLSGSGRSARQV